MIWDWEFGIGNAQISRDAMHRRSLRRSVRSRLLTFRIPQSKFRIGLTLIELLVVIVILTTLVAGVIPILSPNNDTRKIREASRMLQTYIMKAQSEAARTGRDQGIAFRETSPGTGVALDVFRWEVPPAFAGFSSASRVTVVARTVNPLVYGTGGTGNGGADFLAQYDGFPLYDISFVLAATAGPDPDPYPPRMFRIGDAIEVRGKEFLVVDDNDPTMYPNLLLDGFLEPQASPNPVILSCIWLNEGGGQTLPSPTLEPYKFIRQPVTSVEEPLQFPAGIGIDMQGSIAEGGATGGFPIPGSFDNSRPAATQPDTVGIMFSPSGAISDVFHNNNKVTNVSRITLLLGRVENGNLPFEPSTAATFADVTEGGWKMQENTQDELDRKQETVNWLNLDSRWMSIAANSGRVVVTENAFVNARAYFGNPAVSQATDQIEAAHEFSHQMRSTGAGR